MKKVKKSTASSPSIKTAIMFGFLVFVVVLVALFIKIVFIVRASNYDGLHRYTIVFKQSANIADLVTFEKSSNSLAMIHVTSTHTLWPLEKSVSIPVDAIIFSPPPQKESLSSDLMKKIVSVSNNTNNMTSYDLFRLALFARSFAVSKIKTESVTVNDQFDPKILTDVLNDSGINQENDSISITNASDIPGLGASLDKVLTLMGGNVIMVNTQEQAVAHTSITYAGKKTYTLMKLAALLHVTPVAGNSQGISDILITLGKDGFIPNLPQNRP